MDGMAAVDLTAHNIQTDHLEPGDIILDAVVLLHVAAEEDGRPRLVIANSPGMSWLLQRGMVEGAGDMVRGSITQDD